MELEAADARRHAQRRHAQQLQQAKRSESKAPPLVDPRRSCRIALNTASRQYLTAQGTPVHSLRAGTGIQSCPEQLEACRIAQNATASRRPKWWSPTGNWQRSRPSGTGSTAATSPKPPMPSFPHTVLVDVRPVPDMSRHTTPDDLSRTTDQLLRHSFGTPQHLTSFGTMSGPRIPYGVGAADQR
ncbi:hypothetical protein [Streptomyces sp. NPDC101776]|uniref:hypothetical protein n=1 Tax=Streptomyces sp. NPDC101776 TaxID=3366146 RepID=UPI003817595E